MAISIITANNTASTTTITDDAVIEAVLSFATAVSVIDDALVVNNGSLIGFAASGETVGLASAMNVHLINNGTITGSTAIAFNRGINVPFIDVTTQTVINHGIIQSDGVGHAAIEDDADSANAFMIQRIFNDGQILGEIGLRLGDKNSLTENGGLIRGSSGRAIVGGADNDVVRNWGQIDGQLELGDGANRVENSGSLSSNILSSGGNDIIVNAGDIQGTLNLGGGSNNLTNSGLIRGSVIVATQDDTFVNSGTVVGSVDMGGGNDTLNSSGTIDAFVGLGSGNDTFANSGTVNDQVSLGDGTNTFTNSGTVAEVVFGGVNNDTVTNSGTFQRAVFMLGGNDTLVNHGSVGGSVTFGAGNDRLENAGRLLGGANLGGGTNVFVNLGFAAGAISFGDGSDTVENDGTLMASVTLLGGEDLFFSSSNAFTSLVDGGAGQDSLFGSGQADSFEGGDGNDLLNGFAGNDFLAGENGNDTLVGGAGADDLDGGADLDVASYENANLGVTASLLNPATNTGEAAGDVYRGIEGLIGTGFSDTLIGDGGNNTLRGGNGDDVLDGSSGADVLSGEAGSDTYIVDSSDLIIESSASVGFDAVLANTSFALDASAHIELIRANAIGLALTGNGFAQLIEGSAGNDVLAGGGGADTLIGGVGRDQLTGGAASDRFVFNVALAKSNIDTITSFIHDQDIIALDDAIFGAIGASLTRGEFFAKKGAIKAHDRDDRIIYDTKTGKLFYDADGSKSAHKAIHFATLDNKPLLDHGDFLIV